MKTKEGFKDLLDMQNIGGGENPTPLNQLVGKIERYLGKRPKIVYKSFHKTDMKETWADITKAQSILNWSPKIDIDEGLQKTIYWYLENRSWMKAVKV